MRTMLKGRVPGEDVAKRGGNAGAMENVENQTAVSHVSHRPLEITQGAISTFPPRRRRFPPSEEPKKELAETPSGRV